MAGITDGSYTELLGENLHENDELIVEGPAGDSGAGTPAQGQGQGQGQRSGGGSQPPRMRGIF